MKILRHFYQTLRKSIEKPNIILNQCDIKTEATVYIHWPYCEKRCTYCNFNKYISKNVDYQRMEQCLVAEATTMLNFSQAKTIKSIFFGGGTPSLANPKIIDTVIKTISNLSKLPENAEITVECNPNDLNYDKLKFYKEIGVNRISLGVQTLNDHDLKILGRTHDVSNSFKSLEIAKEIFPSKTSIDIIFGRPGQTNDDWEKELQNILQICDNHISIYQLTLERGTSLFKKVKNGELKMPNIEIMEDMYETAERILEQNGFLHYEVSNYSKNGAESIHNQSYWDGSQYIGIGPGAHSRIYNKNTRYSCIQTLEPNVWMTEVEKKGHGTRQMIAQSPKDTLSEVLMTSMRTIRGLSNRRWLQLYKDGPTINEVFWNNSSLEKLTSCGFLLPGDGEALIPTKKGIAVADTIVAELLPYVLHIK